MEKIALSKAAGIIRRRDDVLRSWCKTLGIEIELVRFGFRSKRYISAASFDRLMAFSATQPRQKSPACGRLWDAERDYRNPTQKRRDVDLGRRIVAASQYKRRTFGGEVCEEGIQSELAAMK